MARHLTEPNAVSALRRGKEVEQLLGFGSVEGRRTIRWLTLGPSEGRFRLRVHHVFDVGDGEELWDASELPSVDAAEDHGEGRSLATTDTPEEALALASSDHGADPGRWVNFAVITDEVNDHRP